MTDAVVAAAYVELTKHMKQFGGHVIVFGTFASDEFDRLYLIWTRARWDRGDTWVLSVWKERP